MEAQIKEYLNEIKAFKATNVDEVEAFRIRFLGKKGLVNALFAEFKALPGDEKRKLGQPLNQLKNAAAQKVKEAQEALETSGSAKAEGDLSRPAHLDNLGARHPVNLVKNEIINIFKHIFIIEISFLIIANYRYTIFLAGICTIL